jgi:sigma-B regulation protein RsbU (phosphoserine phosphatase)
MATFQASIHSLAARPVTLDEIVHDLNAYACDHSLFGMRFTTAFLAEWNSAARGLRYINAGHNAPFLRRASGEIERLEKGGLPVGIQSTAKYESGTVAMAAGDLLVIFTDGLAEAVNSAGEEFSELRIQRRVEVLVNMSAATVIGALMSDVDAFVGAARQHDDITCMAVRFS